tara:strand:+ start:13284 stop:13751 length:468 start_codon:yes stop_codon:yes gene_type:complete
MTLIHNYPAYTIDEHTGEVFSIKRQIFMKIFLNNSGYDVVQLSKYGKSHSYTIAKLLALTFIPNPENKQTIDHINRDRRDNRLENLRWADWDEQCENRRYPVGKSGVSNILMEGNLFRYKKTIRGKTYIKAHTSKAKACFEKYIHERLCHLSLCD